MSQSNTTTLTVGTPVTPAILPNVPAPIIPTPETEIIPALLGGVNSLLGMLPDLIGRVETLETSFSQKGTVSNVVGEVSQSAALVQDIATLFSHLGLGSPSSAG